MLRLILFYLNLFHMTTTIKIFHWLPRVLCILAILFVSMFALDAFDPKLTFWEQLLGFFIHLIPSFALFLFLFIAWKWELAGGIIFMVIGIGLTPSLFTGNYRMNHSFWISMGIIASLTLPFIVVGGLFIMSHYLKKKNMPKEVESEE